MMVMKEAWCSKGPQFESQRKMKTLCKIECLLFKALIEWSDTDQCQSREIYDNSKLSHAQI